MANEEDFRQPTDWERRLLDRLFEASFSGREELLRQMKDAQVRTIDEYGSLGLKVTDRVPAPVKNRIPVEGEFDDIDGVPIGVLLFVSHGVAYELQIYRLDGGPIIKLPDPSELRVTAGFEGEQRWRPA